MTDGAADTNARVRYEPDETPPFSLCLGLGIQLVMLTVTGVVLTPVVVIKAAGDMPEFLSWAVFAAVIVSGVTTVLQAVRFGRIGAGYVLLMGTSGAFISVCIAAIAQGGPAMLATLVVISSLFQFALATRLARFRRIFTPTVAGTVIMLIPVTVMPIIFNMLNDTPEDAPVAAAPLCALVTVIVMVGIALKATGWLRLWAPVIGIVLACCLAGYFGIYDINRVTDADWIGLPAFAWPGFDLEFGSVFWSLLPAFVFVTLVGALETIGDAVGIQHVSWRRSRAADYRAVQGAVMADGVGNLLSGMTGTVPNTTYSTSIAVTELTGVAARSIGIAAGVIFTVLAFCPKALAVVLAVPNPIAGAYIAVLLAMLFVLGMKIVVQDGIDYRNGVIAGVSFWTGVGFQNGLIFPQVFEGFAGGLLQNGMTAGGLVALSLTLFVELARARPRRTELPFSASGLPQLRSFLADFAARNGWNRKMADRLDTAGEETVLALLEQEDDRNDGAPRRLFLIAYREEAEAVLEFIAGTSDENLKDRIDMLGQPVAGAPPEREFSLRLLHHVASSVYHQQYHGTDIVTVRVKSPAEESDS